MQPGRTTRRAAGLVLCAVALQILLVEVCGAAAAADGPHGDRIHAKADEQPIPTVSKREAKHIALASATVFQAPFVITVGTTSVGTGNDDSHNTITCPTYPEALASTVNRTPVATAIVRAGERSGTLHRPSPTAPGRSPRSLARFATNACLVGAAWWSLGPKPAPVLALVTAAAVAPTPVRAEHAAWHSGPWSVTCGGCTFSGDYGGAPLTRTGSCATDCTILSLGLRAITSLENDPFAGMGALEELHLTGNRISVLPVETFDALTSLKILEMQAQQIPMSTLQLGVFDALTSLKHLRLDGNSMGNLPLHIFDALTSLEVLELMGNSISTLPPGIFRALTSLLYLDLSFNSISALPLGIFNQLTSLRSLALRTNSIGTLPMGTFDGLISLEELFLSSNAISTLPPGIFDALVSLWQLTLHGNSISTLPPGIFVALTSLQNLQLQCNSSSVGVAEDCLVAMQQYNAHLPDDVDDPYTTPQIPDNSLTCVPPVGIHETVGECWYGGQPECGGLLHTGTIRDEEIGDMYTFDGKTGYQICEGHGYDEPTCNSIGCCEYLFHQLDYAGPMKTCETLECAPGWTGATGTCTQCPAGQYKADTGPAACTSCPAHSSSLAGSTNVSGCICNDGFTGPDGGACVADGTDSPDDGSCVPFDVSGMYMYMYMYMYM
jgi:hypothetical protein